MSQWVPFVEDLFGIITANLAMRAFEHSVPFPLAIIGLLELAGLRYWPLYLMSIALLIAQGLMYLSASHAALRLVRSQLDHNDATLTVPSPISEVFGVDEKSHMVPSDTSIPVKHHIPQPHDWLYGLESTILPGYLFLEETPGQPITWAELLRRPFLWIAPGTLARTIQWSLVGIGSLLLAYRLVALE
jgi:hypothetical protein